MTSFADRERAEEAKFAHGEERRFLDLARRDKMFARWAAERAGDDAAHAGRLTEDVLHVGGGAAHDAALIADISAYLAIRGYPASDTELERVLRACAAEVAKGASPG